MKLDYKEVFAKNLSSLLARHNKTQTDLVNDLGLNKSTVSTWINATKMPRMNKVEQLASYFGVEKSDLIENKTLTTSSESNTLEPISDAPLHTYQYVPHSVSAGALTTMESINFMPSVNIPDFMMGRYAGNKNIILMPVNGESMNNIIQNEAIIAVLTNVTIHDIHDGDIVVIKNGGDYTVKRFYNDIQRQEFIFKPDSTDMSFRDIVISYSNSDDLYLIGKVVMYNVLF